MELTGCEEQVEALAERLNGELTAAPVPGVLTLIPSAEALDPEDAAPVTVTPMSASQPAPCLPHDFTWRVCVPVAAETVALREVLSTAVESAPLSTEYAIDPTACPSQLVELAESPKGEVNVDPLPGLLTVTPSDAAAAPVTSMATSVTHEAPLLPQDFTWTVWSPVVAGTSALMDVLSTTVVSLLLSSE